MNATACARHRVAVLGGGISGLSLSWYLRVAAAAGSHTELVLVEGSDRVGGWIKSDVDSGHVFERGPRGFRPSGTGVQALRLIEEIGLAQHAVRPEDAAKNRFLYVDGRLQKMPSSAADVLLRMPNVLRRAIGDVLLEPTRPRGLWSDESIHDFVSRRFGAHVSEKIVGGMVSGIYAGDTRALSLRACFPRLWELERDHGSIVKGLLFPGKKTENVPGSVAAAADEQENPVAGITSNDSAFVREFSKAAQVSFTGGMEQLTRTLEERLREDSGVRIIKGDPVSKIFTYSTQGEVPLTNVPGTHHGASVVLDSGEVIECDHIFSTLPAPALSNALVSSLEDECHHEVGEPQISGHARLASGISQLLDNIDAVDVGVVNLAFSSVPEKLKIIPGFGYLVPSSENDRVLGVSFDSCIFPTQGDACVTPNHTIADSSIAEDKAFRVCVMIGGVHGRDVIDMTEEELLKEAKSGLSRHVGLNDADLGSIIAFKAGVMRQCIPQYRVGHNALVRDIEKALDSTNGLTTANQFGSALTVLGNSFYGNV
eukprot:g788.t1